MGHACLWPLQGHVVRARHGLRVQSTGRLRNRPLRFCLAAITKNSQEGSFALREPASWALSRPGGRPSGPAVARRSCRSPTSFIKATLLKLDLPHCLFRPWPSSPNASLGRLSECTRTRLDSQRKARGSCPSRPEGAFSLPTEDLPHSAVLPRNQRCSL